MTKVFIDPGHGGRDPGAVGNGIREKDIVLPVSLKVGEILKRHNVDVVYSRTTDVFLELHERTRKANGERADVFVSIHCNSATNTSARGVETFSYPGSREGAKLSKSIQDNLVGAKIFTANRGTKTANFHVIRASSMPAALVELGFISNSQDARLLQSKQDEMAEAIAKGVLGYLGIAYRQDNKKQDRIVKLNIKGIDISANGFNKNNTNYIKIGRHDIPVRDLGVALNLNVSWDNRNKVVIMK